MTSLPDDPNRAREARRRFLAFGVTATGLALSPLGRLLAATGDAAATAAGYGPLRPVLDDTTKQPLLLLPDGFSYRSFGWTGSPLSDGTPTPRAHDGMGVLRGEGDRIVLVRNHEVVRADGAFGPASSHYDAACSGGTVTLEFDLARGELVQARPSLSGTLQNCAGGLTPCNTWLSCEELVSRADTPVLMKDGQAVLKRDHGFVFEVPAQGLSNAEPLLALGQFKHEAALVHEPSGIVYLTEDAYERAGFYRCLPTKPGDLQRGGRLQMLRVKGREEMRRGLRAGQRFAVDWVEIEEPTRGVDPADGEHRGVQRQGFAHKAACFTRLEGIIATDTEIFFTATDGGDAACGQLWVYLPGSEELMLVYESPDPATLDYPDNIVLSPRGGLVLCQDSKGGSQRLYGIGRDGSGLFEFARNNTQLDGVLGFSGDFRGAEWAGACFSPDGKWLFANVYTPGYTVAITGPWKHGLI